MLRRKKNEGYGDASERQVDVETPPPRNVCRKHSAQKGTDDGREAKHGTEYALEYRPLMEGNSVDKNHKLYKKY